MNIRILYSKVFIFFKSILSFLFRLFIYSFIYLFIRLCIYSSIQRETISWIAEIKAVTMDLTENSSAPVGVFAKKK